MRKDADVAADLQKNWHGALNHGCLVSLPVSLLLEQFCFRRSFALAFLSISYQQGVLACEENTVSITISANISGKNTIDECSSKETREAGNDYRPSFLNLRSLIIILSCFPFNLVSCLFARDPSSLFAQRLSWSICFFNDVHLQSTCTVYRWESCSEASSVRKVKTGVYSMYSELTVRVTVRMHFIIPYFPLLEDHHSRHSRFNRSKNE